MLKELKKDRMTMSYEIENIHKNIKIIFKKW